ncbi:uncharacterized protein F5147DRAFT_657817 [Suillus discolor]|uniref:Uncharacterized protein n=1 Tax=Suillus discolor TaxID=1912936 RepID=A0A9P7JNA4_9AGAM|nr:uncharacterized protein F5147DRAFT_657817 [Suillus discolor]KAG2091992.1 hypothetical protein F5147DRAFT_657817 [Suillus discolor]
MTTRNRQQANVESDKGKDDQGPPAKKMRPTAIVQSIKLVEKNIDQAEADVNRCEESNESGAVHIGKSPKAMEGDGSNEVKDCDGENSSLAPVTAMNSSTDAKRKKESGRKGATQTTTTVRSVIPNPTKQLVDLQEVEQYTEDMKVRIEKLSTYVNAKAGVYALGSLLPNATWGPYKAIRDHSKVVCDPMTGEPLMVWIVGHIARLWFMKQDRPDNQASITVIPLSQALAQQSAAVLVRLSNPQIIVEGREVRNIRAVKWQSTKENGKASEPVLFDDVYDVRNVSSLKSYDERPLWQVQDLKKGDLVLLEAKITKYSMKNDNGKWFSRAQYEMIAISLLNMSEIWEIEEKKQEIEGLSI